MRERVLLHFREGENTGGEERVALRGIECLGDRHPDMCIAVIVSMVSRLVAVAWVVVMIALVTTIMGSCGCANGVINHAQTQCSTLNEEV